MHLKFSLLHFTLVSMTKLSCVYLKKRDYLIENKQ